MKIELEVGAGRRTFAVSRQSSGVQLTDEKGRVTVIRARRLDANVWELDFGGRRRRVAGAVLDAQRRAVWTDGSSYAVRRVPAGRHAAAPESTAKELGATIPSVVREVLVAVGDLVAPGDKLILLESMKMVLPIVASQAGAVRAILCAPGESVLPGVPLVEVGPAA